MSTTEKKKDQIETTELVKRRVEAVTLATNLDEMIAHGSAAYIAANTGSMAETLSLAVAVLEIKNALTPDIMRPLMSLQGSAIGFKTDKPYPEEIVKEATVESLIKGVPMVGNCTNIIAGRAYVTKEGFSFLINKLQREVKIKGFAFTLEPPTVQGQRTLVHGKASWEQNGENQTLECDLPIKTNSASTDDNTLGKAERKLKARCYERMTGLCLSDGDVNTELQATGDQGRPAYVTDDGTGVIPGAQSSEKERASERKETPALKPVADMDKKALLAEIGTHSQAAYYMDVLGQFIPDECTTHQASESLLRDMLTMLRVKAAGVTTE